MVQLRANGSQKGVPTEGYRHTTMRCKHRVPYRLTPRGRASILQYWQGLPIYPQLQLYARNGALGRVHQRLRHCRLP